MSVESVCFCGVVADGCSTIHSAVKEKSQALLFQKKQSCEESQQSQKPNPWRMFVPDAARVACVPFHEMLTFAGYEILIYSNRPSQNTQNPLFYGERDFGGVQGQFLHFM